MLRSSFTTAVMKEMPNSDQWMIEKGDRTDLRHSHLIYSIDPQGCEDVDDALSVKWVCVGVATVSIFHLIGG